MTKETAKPRQRIKKIDTEKALELRLKGVSLKDIADHFGTSKQAVHQCLAKFTHLIDPDSLRTYRNHRGDVFALKQAAALSAMTDEKLEASSARDLATIAGILYDKERLETGQSTENHAVHVLTEAIRGSVKKNPS